MKRFLASSLKVAALAFTFASTASAAVTTILADNFDHYDLTNAPAASTWTQAMSSGTHKWVSAGSPNSIAKAEARQIVAAPGREGNAFLYKEFATDATYPYIYSTLDEGILDATATWEFRIDFYVDQVENTNGYWLFALYGAPTRNSSDVIVRAQVRRNGSNIALGIPFKATPGGSTVTTQLQIAGQSWHTLTITGNNATQQFTMSLNGPQIAEGYYLNNSRRSGRCSWGTPTPPTPHPSL